VLMLSKGGNEGGEEGRASYIPLVRGKLTLALIISNFLSDSVILFVSENFWPGEILLGGKERRRKRWWRGSLYKPPIPLADVDAGFDVC
jgi:hypothetical protein